ncbi:Cas10/Cmr2 second palm domain-containing protein [Streptomyces sp. NPDC101221]|uniref:Cas10/Cmr2 second palm domain-containing protein n=1 Tax=Streptomyces sp. NPDC101221 TaxID=3366132 RepID=UPI00380AD49F
MQMYLDVGAVRIQQYLSRTPDLRARRAASAALADTTRIDPQDPMIAGRAEVNAAAGEADGVLNLVLTGDPAQPYDAAEAARRAETLARELLGRLRADLPGAEFRAGWAEASDYPSAYRLIDAKYRAGDGLESLPVVPEFPLTVPCRVCHTASSTGRVSSGGSERQDACADCVRRYSARARKSGKAQEEQLLSSVQRRLDRTLELAPDLSALTLSRGADAGNRGLTQIATVYIDGNAFGMFFDQLAAHGTAFRSGGRALVDKGAISRALNEHTRTALTDATCAVVREDDTRMVVVPHLVGGDDVLVSLPADRAWPFVLHYLDRFNALVQRTRGEAAGFIKRLPELSASAGIAFSHPTHPFHLLVEAADQRLRRAKQAVVGVEASVDFVDLTADGPHGGDLPALRVQHLLGLLPQLDALTKLPGSRLTKWESALRAAHAAGTVEAALDVLLADAERLGCSDIVQPFLPEDSGVRPAIGLRQALRITRWWS